jgi:hypothetical protein
MKIKFTHDFRGALTNEQFYLAGTEIDVDEDTAKALIAQHHAVAVEDAPPPPPEPAPKPKRRSRRADKSD